MPQRRQDTKFHKARISKRLLTPLTQLTPLTNYTLLRSTTDHRLPNTDYRLHPSLEGLGEIEIEPTHTIGTKTHIKSQVCIIFCIYSYTNTSSIGKPKTIQVPYF